jgi:Fic family protein
LDRAETILASVLSKARFWKQHAGASFNDHQRLMIDRLFNGLAGKLTSSKWAQLAKCSQDTALRDIDDLVARAVLSRDAPGGRSTSYAALRNLREGKLSCAKLTAAVRFLVL